MNFYCVYCNRLRSGIKNTLEEKTDEHFIPRSIGGRWKIYVCRNCNEQVGRTCDAFLKEVSWTYKLYRQGIAEVKGLAELNNGIYIPAYFKYQTTENGHHQFFACHNLTTKVDIQRNEIKSLLFQAQNPDDVINTYPAVAKIALGGIYYLLITNKKRNLSTQIFISSLIFADIRETFLKTGFKPGGSGSGHGCIIKSFSSSESAKFLNLRESPSIRRHYISMECTNSNLYITLCLYSAYFWSVRVPKVSLEMEKLENEILLKDLSLVDPTRAATLMNHDGKTWIKILL